jgi:hypothetical protein
VVPHFYITARYVFRLILGSRSMLPVTYGYRLIAQKRLLSGLNAATLLAVGML